MATCVDVSLATQAMTVKQTSMNALMIFLSVTMEHALYVEVSILLYISLALSPESSRII